MGKPNIENYPLRSRDLARQRLTVQNRKPSMSVIPMGLLICQFLGGFRNTEDLEISWSVGAESGEEAENEFEFERRCKGRPWGSGSPLTTTPLAEVKAGIAGTGRKTLHRLGYSFFF
jgi:hypothetical protein